MFFAQIHPMVNVYIVLFIKIGCFIHIFPKGAFVAKFDPCIGLQAETISLKTDGN